MRAREDVARVYFDVEIRVGDIFGSPLVFHRLVI